MAVFQEQRVATTNMLWHIIKDEDKYEFNRRHDEAELAKVIDEEGFHLLVCVVPYHRASFGPTREPIWPDHHRAIVYVKCKGTDAPEQLQMDVSDKVWNALPTTDMFMEVVEKVTHE